MKLATYRIPYRSGETIRVFVFCDVHKGNKFCDWRQFCTDIAKYGEMPNTYFLGLGDYLDCIIASDSKRYRPSMQEWPEEDAVIDRSVDTFIKPLLPYKDRIIGLGTGNHEDVITRRCGTNPTARMCEKLGCDFLGYSFLLRLVLSDNGGRSRKVVIRGHHGWGGGSRTQGGDLTKFSRDTDNYVADAYLYGHVHRKQHDRKVAIAHGGKRPIAKAKILAICGTYLKTLSNSSAPTYSERAGYPPSEIGGLSLLIKPLTRGFDLKVES